MADPGQRQTLYFEDDIPGVPLTAEIHRLDLPANHQVRHLTGVGLRTNWTKSSSLPIASHVLATASTSRRCHAGDQRRQVTHLMVGREIEAVDLGVSGTPGMSSSKYRVCLCPGSACQGPGVSRCILHVAARREFSASPADGRWPHRIVGVLVRFQPHATGGAYLLEGREVHFKHPAEARDAGVALVTEDRKRPGLFAHMTVGANITMCTLPEARMPDSSSRAANAGWLKGGAAALPQDRRSKHGDHQSQRR